MTSITGTQAPKRSVAASTRSINPQSTQGRAPSWMSTTSGADSRRAPQATENGLLAGFAAFDQADEGIGMCAERSARDVGISPGGR